MSVKHVWISARGVEQMVDDAHGPIPIVQSRPTIDAPGDGPAGRDISAFVEADLGGLGKFRRATRRDLRAGEKRIQMGDVAMLLLPRLRIPILEPFLQLPLLANLKRREPGTGFFQLLAKGGIR